MARKDDKDTGSKVARKATPVLQPFFFPTIDNGITVHAADCKAAQKIAEKIRESLSTSE